MILHNQEALKSENGTFYAWKSELYTWAVISSEAA